MIALFCVPKAVTGTPSPDDTLARGLLSSLYGRVQIGRG